MNLKETKDRNDYSDERQEQFHLKSTLMSSVYLA
jgi:hypothetical protein